MSKYTTKEILVLAGVESPETTVGQMRVRIGGLSVRALDQIINVQTPSIDITVGNKTATIEVPEREEASEELKAANAAKFASPEVSTEELAG